jgi:hypothetical protein
MGKRIFMMNGWQRIWVVISLFWLAITCLSAWDERPTADKITHSWAIASLELVKDHDKSLTQSTWSIRAAYDDLSDKEFLDLLQKSQKSAQIDFSEINAKYLAKNKNLFTKQVMSFLGDIGSWFAFIVILYLCGFSVGWIARGFRN